MKLEEQEKKLVMPISLLLFAFPSKKFADFIGSLFGDGITVGERVQKFWRNELENLIVCSILRCLCFELVMKSFCNKTKNI